MKNFIFQLESLGANVIACFSIGRTYYSRTDGFNPIHPWSETSLRSGLKVEPVSTDISISTEDIFKHEIRIDSDPQIPNLVEPCIKHESQKVEPPVSQNRSTDARDHRIHPLQRPALVVQAEITGADAQVTAQRIEHTHGMPTRPSGFNQTSGGIQRGIARKD